MKPTAMDEATILEFKRLAALIQNQSGIRLNVDQVVAAKDERTLRIWEKTLLARQEMKRL